MSATALPILANARIASPCSADWNEMTGDQRVRFCGSCEKNVYNLTDLPTEEAEAIILEHEGNLCVRLYQRTDGTLISEDCPRGLAAARRTLRRGLGALIGLFAVLLSSTVLRGINSSQRSARLAYLQPFKWLNDRLDPPMLRTGIIAGRIGPGPILSKDTPSCGVDDDNGEN